MNEDGRPTVELERRDAKIVDVSFPQRLIELIVMPYETETTIYERGRDYVEIVTRGAFDGIQSRNGGSIKVNRDHDVTRSCGLVKVLHPSRQEGLVAELKISQTELGQETLQLAEDGILGASAGFGLMRKDGRTGPVVPNAEIWESRKRRRLNKLFLGHVALTADPAYPAPVLSVRQTGVEAERPVTPNLDAVDLQRWRDEYARLDAKWLAGGQPTGVR
jgi:phage head maturation protease